MADSYKNPFDILRDSMDEDASFDENVKHLYGLLTEGKMDLHAVAELLANAAAMPILADENRKLCNAVNDLMRKLDVADETIRDLSGQLNEIAVESQDGMTSEDEKLLSNKFLKFPGNPVIN